jgi:hypothetical protein
MDVSGQLHTPATFSQGKHPQYLLDRRLDGPQSQSGLLGGEKNLTPARNQTPAIHPVAHCYTSRAIPALSDHIDDDDDADWLRRKDAFF